MSTRGSATVRDDVAVGLRRLQRLLSSRRVAARQADAAGVELPQQAIEVLRVLGDGQARPVGTIARDARMDVGAVSRQLALLEGERMIRRRDGAGVEATAAGRSAATRVDAVRAQHLDDVFSGWTRDERDEFGRLLVRFVDALASTPYRAPRRSP